MAADIPTPPPPQAGEAADKAHRGFWIVPLLSALTFFVILVLYACGLNLNQFDWKVVATNVANRAEAPKVIPKEAAASSKQDETKNQPADVVTKEIIMRIFWGSTALLFGFLCLCAISLSFRTFHAVFNPTIWHIAVGILIVGILMAGALRYLSGPVSCVSGGNVAEQLLSATETNSSPLRIIKAPATGEKLPTLPSSFPRVRKFTALMSSGAVAGLFSVTMAVSFLVGAMRRLNVTSSRSPQHFEHYAASGLTLMQLTAIALVIGVLAVYFLFSMASYQVDPILTKEVQHFARGAATATGFIYTGMLAAIFLPMGAGQRTVARRILEEHEKTMDKETAKRFRQLAHSDATAWPVIKAGVTLLSPLLASFVTKLFASLATHF